MSSPEVERILCSRLTESAAVWWREALSKVRAEGVDQAAFQPLWSGAGRRLGRAALDLSSDEEKQLPFPAKGWGADELGRALLLLAALEGQPSSTHVALVEELYRTGELRERQALLRVLSYLPDANRFAAVGIEAVRSNATSVIEAIACDNPYPAENFPDDAYAQMVIKCLTSELSLRRVRGLARRTTPELKRMVSAYASERRAAGRSVSADAMRVLEGDVDAPV